MAEWLHLTPFLWGPMRRSIVSLLVAAGFFLVGAAAGRATNAAPEPAYWGLTMIKMKPTELDSLRALLRQSAPARVEARKTGVERYWLVQEAGAGDHDVVLVTRWRSWNAIHDTTAGFSAMVWRRAMPDSAQRTAWFDRFRRLVVDLPRQSSLYQEIAAPDR
jgi:hypothetical protein